MDDDGSLEDSVEAGEADQMILDVHLGPPVLPRLEVAEVPDMSVLSAHIIRSLHSLSSSSHFTT